MKSIRYITGELRLAVAALWLAGLASPQVPTIGAITPSGAPTAPSAGSSFEQYNGFNGALNLSFPLHHIGGRGEAGFDLVWNSQPNWVAAYNGPPPIAFLFAQPYPGENVSETTNGFGLGGPGGVYIRTGYDWGACSNGSYQPNYTLTTLTFVMANGGQLSLTDTATNGATKATPGNYCTSSIPSQWDVGRGTSFRSTDGSQIQFNATSNVEEQTPNSHGYGVATVSGTLVFPTGMTYTVVNSVVTIIEDRSGNKITLGYAPPAGGPATFTYLDWYVTVPALTQVIDSLNRVTSINYNYTDGGACGSCLAITYPGEGTTTNTVKVVVGSLGQNLRMGSTETIGTLFSPSLFGSSNTFNPSVATAIVEPDATQYSFQYNAYGEVARVTMPTGGAIEYDYAAGSGTQNGFVESASGGGVMIYRRLQERREYSSSGGGTGNSFTSATTHTVSTPTGGSTIDTVQVYAAGSTIPGTAPIAQTVHTFQGSPTDSLNMTATSCNGVNEGLETQTMSGYPSTLLTITNSYSNGNASSCLYNPQVTNVTTNDEGVDSNVVYAYDSYGNITDEKDYDWGAGASGGLLREIQTSYAYQNNAGYANPAVNLIHLPYNRSTLSGSTVVAQTAWRYDEVAPNLASGIINNDDAEYGPAHNLRGHVTDSYQALNGGYLQTSGTHYDVGGNVAAHADADGNQMNYAYNTDGSSGMYAFPTQITNQLGQSTNLKYDYNAGKPTSVTDPLGNTTTYAYVDHLNRLTQINEPTGAVTTISYTQPILTTVLHTQSASPAASTHSEVVTDGFGRDIEDRQYTDAQHLIAIDHGYDAMGRISFQANPTLITVSGWTNDGLAYHTVYGYDSLSRVTQVTLPDGNPTTTSYSGNATTVTDPASHATKTLMDALGRLSSVYEDAGSSPHLNLQTEYTYDALGDLTLVSKCLASGCGSGQENRSFTYDSLRRLTQATNPESGTYTYSYTNSSKGNQLALQSRMDPRGFTTTYTHDGMDRVTGIGYNDGTPNGSYTYNAIGKLTQASNSNVTNNYTAFDADGRVTASNMQVGSVTYTFAYQYDLGGDLIQETYPSGRVVNTTYDAAMRPLTASGTSGSTVTHYVQGAGYYPHGAPQYWAYGNGLWSWETFSKLLQPYQGWATQGNNGNNWMFYAGNSFNANETVSSQQEGFSPPNTPGVPWNSMTFLNGQFGYDSLNRLNSVADTNYARTYHYDEFGNLSLQTSSGVPLSGVTPVNNGVNPYTAATNHLVTVDATGGYDPRGNMTKLGAVTMGFDAESNMTSTVDGGTGQNVSWVYDAEGQRAQKLIAGGSWTLYIHDAFGQLAASYNNNGVTPTCTTCYLTYDMVGTPRLITDQNQNVVARHDFIPFGEEIQNGVAGRNGSFGYTSNVTQAFTGQESDGGTIGLDYFNARHFTAVLGRFVQPDPMNAGANVLNPQSWNAYAYVLGNPLALVDTSGLADCSVGVDFCDTSYGFDGSEVDTSGASININLFPGGSLSGQCSLCGVKGARGGATGLIFAITHTDVGLGYSPFSAGSSAPSNPAQPTACQAKTLDAINSQFGTNLTAANILPTSDPNPQANGGQVNTNFGVVSGLSAAQFNAIQSGRYAPPGVFGFLTGYGSSLHVVGGPSGLDPSANVFGTSNIGGMYSAGFTAHFDSAWANNPLGALLHYLIDVRGHGAHRQPC